MDEHVYDMPSTTAGLHQTNVYREAFEESYRTLPLENLRQIVQDNRKVGLLARMFKLSPADRTEMKAAEKVYGERTGKPAKIKTVMEMMDYSRKTRETYENLPDSQLQAIIRNYDSMGFWDSILAPESIVIEAEVARSLLVERTQASE